SGGDLGSFGPGQMVKEFDTVVFSAPVGVVQGPVKTQFGYHLLEVTSRQD
ncbi:MAG: peptidylprolyl isomerase, partial [Pseudomonas sp. 34-62-33]